MSEPGSPEELEDLVNSPEWEIRGRALMAGAAAVSGRGYSGYDFGLAIAQADRYLRNGPDRA